MKLWRWIRKLFSKKANATNPYYERYALPGQVTTERKILDLLEMERIANHGNPEL